MPIAKKYGFDFTYEELREYKKSMDQKEGQELQGGLLAGVTGGDSYCYCPVDGIGNVRW